MLGYIYIFRIMMKIYVCPTRGGETPLESFVPTFTFWDLKIYFYNCLFVAMLSLLFQNHHVTRSLDVETCCEEINVKSFVKLQFCQEEVREIERTRLGKRSGFLLLNSNVSFSLSLSVVFLCQFLCKTHQCLIRIRMD